MDNMKKGIALLITIGFITILTSMIAYMLSTSEKVFDEAKNIDSRNQSSIFYKDGKKIVDSYVKKIKSNSDLDLFLSKVALFIYQRDDSLLHVEVTPLSNKININSILINKKTDKNLVIFLENICANYNILDSQLLIDLILDTIDKDDISRQALSEISREDVKFSNSRIVNSSHLETIVDYYVKTANDKNILEVPWDKLVYFGEAQKEKVDCDRMDTKLVNILGLDTQSYTGCDDLEDNQSKKIAQDYGLEKFSKANNYYILVKIYYKIDGIENKISFMYNIKTNKASNIEL